MSIERYRSQLTYIQSLLLLLSLVAFLHTNSFHPIHPLPSFEPPVKASQSSSHSSFFLNRPFFRPYPAIPHRVVRHVAREPDKRPRGRRVVSEGRPVRANYTLREVRD